MADSLCCTLETNTALQNNDAPIKKKNTESRSRFGERVMSGRCLGEAIQKERNEAGNVQIPFVSLR